SVGENATLKVNNFLPQTEPWPYAPAGDRERQRTFRALLIRLTSPMMGGQSVPRWIVGEPNPAQDRFPLLCEFFRLSDPALLREFLEPPPAKELGKDGQLVLVVGKQRFRYRIDRDRLNEKIKVGDTGLTLEITGVVNLLEEAARQMHKKDLKLKVNYPAVKFRLSRGEETTEWMSCARIPDQLFPVGDEAVPEVAAWYHTHDQLW